MQEILIRSIETAEFRLTRKPGLLTAAWNFSTGSSVEIGKTPWVNWTRCEPHEHRLGAPAGKSRNFGYMKIELGVLQDRLIQKGLGWEVTELL